MSATLLDMPREKKAPTTTVRVPVTFADELEVIVDYLDDIRTGGKEVTVGSLLEEWCKPHISKYKQKAIDHRIEKLNKMRNR